ncbi:MAG: CDP-alcohol phosphatidyltransferase family protein [Chromatiales bacterium]
MSARDIPNLITVGRIILTVPTAWALIQDRFGLALALFAVAGVSDGVDGYLAKRYGWHSRLGSLLDPAADKLLLLTAFVTLGWHGLLPAWLVVGVIVRDLLIVAGATTYHFWIEPFEGEPSRISKLNTLVQILLVVLVVADRGLIAMPPLLLDAMVWIVAATTFASGADYVWVWGRRAALRRSRPDDP